LISCKTTQTLKTVLKPASVKKLCEVDITSALQVLNKLPNSYWLRQDRAKQNDYPVFHSTQHIIMRFTEPNGSPRRHNSYLSWKLFSPAVLPLMNQVSNRLDIKNPVYSKAMLARLKPHSVIEPHIDRGSSYEFVHKIHIPLISQPDVEFIVEDKVFFLQPGYAYEVNNLKKHGVSNPTNINRVHFIFEVFDSVDESNRVKTK